jgi:hypothetical protein
MPSHVRPAGVQSFGSPMGAMRAIDVTRCGVGVEVGGGVATGDAVAWGRLGPGEPEWTGVGAGPFRKPQPATRAARAAAPAIWTRA